MRFHRGTRLTAVLLLLGLSVAACDDGTSPTDEFDPQVAVDAVESMTAAMATQDLEDAFGSLQWAGMLFAEAGAMVAHPLAMDVEGLQSFRAVTAADVIPTDYRGLTFEWDAEQMSYMPTEAAGAPSDGVRVIYYAIDPTSGLPATPLNPLGHVDLRDLSTQASDRLNVEVVRSADAVTLADYYLDVSFTFTQNSAEVDLAAVGLLSNGTDQLNFDVSQALMATETEFTLDLSYALDLEGTGNAMSFTLTMTGDPQSEFGEPESLDVSVMVTDGSQTVEIEITWAGDSMTGTVSHNGVVVAHISGDPDNPQFTDPDGNPLTQEQVNGLRSVWESVGNLFEFVDGLVGFLLY